MFSKKKQRPRLNSRSDRTRAGWLKLRSRRLTLEALEPRQMLSGTPVSTGGLVFHVVDDATANVSYQYNTSGSQQGSATLVAANAAPRGVVSVASADKTWIIDANRNVYVYNTAGTLLGSWSAGSLATNATPEGIATDGNDIWIVDSKSDKVFRYAGAASRLSGSQTVTSSFSLNSSNTNPKDIVTDGAALWTVDDGSRTDRVFKYSLTGSLVGSWTIDSANKAPTGITFDPMNVHDMWIVDSSTDRIYEYVGAASRTAGSQVATTSLALGTNDKTPQGIALVHGPSAETPLDISWVRQFGSAGDDRARGGAVDSAGNAYVSGQTDGSLAVANPNGGTTPFLAKYDTNGNPVWVTQQTPIAGVNYSGLAANVSGSTNVFQVISPERDASGTFVSGASLASYDTSGSLQWTTPLPTSEDVFSVTSDAGYSYMSSYAGSTIHVRKFEVGTGTIIWDRTFDTGGTTNTSGISADGLGSIYVSAYTYGSAIGANAGLADGILAKFTSSGDLVWAREFGTVGYDFAFNVSADMLGSVFVSGGVYASQDALNAGDQDMFLTKFDAAGNLQWTRQLGTTANDQSSSPWADNLGNVYLTGASQGALGGPNQGGFDIVTMKYDSSGKMMWTKQYGTSGNDVGGANKLDLSGNLYIVGRTNASWGGPNAGGDDVLLIKLSAPGGSNASSSQNSLSLVRSTGSTTANSTSRQNAAVLSATNVLSSTDAAQKLSLLQAIHEGEMGKTTTSQFSASCRAVDAALAQGIGEKWSDLLDEVLESVS